MSDNKDQLWKETKQVKGKPYDYIFKILLFGDSGTDKTAILVRYTEDSFNSAYRPISTIGVDFRIKHIEIEGKKLKLQIWDTANQERFSTITTSYFRGVRGVFLVYDVTNAESFANIQQKLDLVKQHTDDVEVMLLGNKCHLEEDRVVTREEGEMLATKNGLKFFETSAKTNINIDTAFTILATNILRKVESTQKNCSTISDDELTKKCTIF